MMFLAPSFLIAGLALMAIPVLIHILNRRRYKTVEWAAMRYLLAAMKSNRRRLRFESLILLLARCLCLFLLAAAIARPLGCSDSALAAFAGDRVGLHVIILDDSYSMAYEAGRPDARTHFDQARKLARGVVDRLESGSQQVAVIAASTPARVIVRPTHDLDAAAGVIDRLPQSYAGTSLADALALANQIVAETKDAPPLRMLHIVTDCTHGALPTDERLQTVARASVEEAKYKVALHNVGQATQWNQAVVDLRSADRLVRVGFGSDVLASVAGFGGGETKLAWKLDGKPIPGGDVAVRPDTKATPVSQSQASFDRPGPIVLEASIASDDRLKIDDVRRRVIDVAGDLQVLIVEGRRGIGSLAGSGSFLRLALAPPVDPTATTRPARYVAPTAISDLELAGKALGDYRAVILAGVTAPNQPTAQALRDYVTAGGSVVLFMGDRVNGDAYNSALGSVGLLPGALVARVDTPAGTPAFSFAFDPTKPHPVLSAFRDIEKSGLDTAQVMTYWRVQPDAARNVERVLDFKAPSDGSPADPAITLHTLGLGRVVFVATSADAEWSTLVAKPAYVTLMHELLGGAVGGGEAWMNRLVGERVEPPADLTFTAQPILRENDQRTTPLTNADLGNGATAWRSEPIARPGLYTLESGERRWPIAVNVPADEADVRTLDAVGIKRNLGDIDFQLLGDTLPDAASAESDNKPGTDLSWPVLATLLPLLGIESLLAWRFSRGRGRAA